MAQEYGGVYVGICSSTHDPEGMGRIQVNLPSLATGNLWARVSTALGNPHVNGEVLVAFENGDLRRPIVLGGLKGRR